MEKYSNSLVNRKRQVKPNCGYKGMAKIKTENFKYCQGCKPMAVLIHCC